MLINGATNKYAGVAQQVERILGKDEVGGPSPLISSMQKGERKAFPLLHENSKALGPPTLRP